MKISVYFGIKTFFFFFVGLYLRIRENLHVFWDENQNLWMFEYVWDENQSLKWQPEFVDVFFLVFTPNFVVFRVEHLFHFVHTLDFK